MVIFKCGSQSPGENDGVDSEEFDDPIQLFRQRGRCFGDDPARSGGVVDDGIRQFFSGRYMKFPFYRNGRDAPL